MKQETNKSKTEILMENINNVAKLYALNKEKGDLLLKLLSNIKKSHKDIFENIKKELLNYDPNVFEKNNFIQKVAFNKIVITKLLSYKADENNNENIVNVLAVLSYDLKDDAWLKTVKEYVLPYLLKINVFTKE